MVLRSAIGGAIILGSIVTYSQVQADSPSDVKESRVTYDASSVAAGKRANASSKSQSVAAVTSFVNDMARRGRPLDASRVEASVLPEIQLAWERGVAVDSVDYGVARIDGQEQPEAESFETVAHVDEAASTAVNPGSSGLGMAGALSVTGATWSSGYCVTTTSTTGNKVTSCFQKYKISNDGSTTYDYWYYNRWATAEGKQISLGLDYKPTKIDIRSRPWSTASSSVVHLVDYTPRTSSTVCNSLGEVGIGFKGFTAKMPVQDCSNVSPFVNATSRTMGAIYDQGAVFSGRVHGTDFSMVISSPQSVTATMADYNYVKFCKGTYLTCDGVLRKDSGW